MKYEGQNWVISVPVTGKLTAQNLRRLFERRYRAQYGILLDRPIEYVVGRYRADRYRYAVGLSLAASTVPLASGEQRLTRS